MTFPVQEPKMVINSLFTNDKHISIYLSKTHSPFEEIEYPLKDAEVCVYYNNNVEILQNLGEGIFISNNFGIENTEYKITINAEGFHSVSANDYIPEKLGNIIVSDFKDSVSVNKEGDYFSQFTIDFFDDVNKKNYYEVFVETILFGDKLHNIRCFSNDPIVTAEGINDYFPNSIIFSDDFINGKHKKLNIYYYPVAYGKPNGGAGELVDKNYKIILHFRNISENYYKYKKKLAIHIAGKEFNFWEGAGEPIQMFSNISEGFGIFAGYTEKIDTIKKKIF